MPEFIFEPHLIFVVVFYRNLRDAWNNNPAVSDQVMTKSVTKSMAKILSGQ